jgi:hypothetical protein
VRGVVILVWLFSSLALVLVSHEQHQSGQPEEQPVLDWNCGWTIVKKKTATTRKKSSSDSRKKQNKKRKYPVRNSIGFSYPTRLEFGRRSRGGIDTTLL